MGFSSNRLKLFNICRYVSLQIKRSLKYLLLVIVILIALLISITVYRSPTFIKFNEIEGLLVLRKDVNTSNWCRHHLTRNVISEKVVLHTNVTMTDFAFLSRNVKVGLGGIWSPPTCTSRYRVNIIIPFRNRTLQLRSFLLYFHEFLQRQEIEYRITVVEQKDLKPFNRAALFNVGFVEMEKRHPADCYIFHDVDLIPLSLNNIYACTVEPRHISSALDVFDFKLPYATIFGGAVALTNDQFKTVNGFSNLFFGWGGEDDDFYSRVIEAKYTVVRYESKISQMKMLSHAKEVPNPLRFQMLDRGRDRFSSDGLVSLNYSLFGIELKPLCTWLYVGF